MKVIRELLPARQGVSGANAFPTRVAWAMKRSVDHRWFPADILHDVDLAAVGPMCCIDVIAQQPKCRPDTLAKRNPDSCFETAVGLAELVFREHSGRVLVASYIVSAG